MKDSAVTNPFLIDFLRHQIDVRTRLTVKGKITVAIFHSMDKCKSSMDVIIHSQSSCIDSLFHHCQFQLMSEHVVTDLTDKGHFLSEACQHRQHIAWRSAWVRFKQRIALTGKPVLGKIDQQFSQCGHIKDSLFHHFLPPIHTTAAHSTCRYSIRSSFFLSSYPRLS